MLTAGVFLLAYFSALILSVARHPIFGLMAYLGVFYMHPPTRWWSYLMPDLRWSFLAAAATFAGLLVHKSGKEFRPFLRNGMVVALFIFIAWLLLQSFWALDSRMHTELIDYYIKFTIAVALIYKCVEKVEHLKMLLWVHVLGCFAFGWYAFFAYEGGRFEDFGGPGFSDANFAGMQAVTGIFAAAGLMLAGKKWERIGIVFVAPFIVNGLITTMSRSSFLALFCGGAAFVWFCPPKFRMATLALGAAGLVGFLTLTNDQYWDRIGTILMAGEEVQGVDTGSSRLVVWKAQAEMFKAYPLGCGHRCTATLSPAYLDDQYLTGDSERRARSSHNTFMTMLVEQGIVGAVLYISYVFWIVSSAFRLKRRLKADSGPLAGIVPTAVAILLALTVADVFVDYLKLEVRIWYIAVMLVIFKLAEHAAVTDTASGAPPPIRAKRWPIQRGRPSASHSRVRS